MDKVYIVVAGCYDDYRVEAVFSDDEKAKKYIEDRDRASGKDYREIMEYYLDVPLSRYTVYGTYSYDQQRIMYKQMMYMDDIPHIVWNVRHGDYFSFAVSYEEKFDDEAVLLKTVRALADGASGV